MKTQQEVVFISALKENYYMMAAPTLQHSGARHKPFWETD